jgi:hypothetical protein
MNQAHTMAIRTEVAVVPLHIQIATDVAGRHHLTARRHGKGDKTWQPPSTAPN